MRLSRRNWFRAAGAAGIGLGLTATQTDKLIPFLIPPENIVPGVATWYATTCRECPAGCGMLGRNREARVVKCEGNPDHPISRGHLCARGQAALQGLYDPDRIPHPLMRNAKGESRSGEWHRALDAIGQRLRPLRGTGRVAVISDLQTGSLGGLIRRWLAAFEAGPERHLIFEPLNYAALRRGNQIAFGRDAIPAYQLDQADFILALGADFLDTWISPVRQTGQFADMRRARDGRMGGFVYAGPRLSLTAANADRRLQIRPGHEGALGLAVLHVIGGERLGRRHEDMLQRLAAKHSPEVVGPVIGVEPEHIRAVARAFARAQRPIALAGSPFGERPEALEAVVAADLLNYAADTPVADFARPHALGQCADEARMREFVASASTTPVDVLIVLGANPLYALPRTHGLAELIRTGAETVVSLSPFMDETAVEADWVLPTSHSLESWGDYEPESGVRGLIQPTMGEVFGTRSVGDVLLSLAQAAGIDPATAFGAAGFYEYLRNDWRSLQEQVAPGEDFESFWTRALQRGGRWSTKGPEAPTLAPTVSQLEFSAPSKPTGVALHAYPSMALFDGRGANKSWLQELPDPMLKTVWDSWVEVPKAEAASQGVSRGDLVEFAIGPQSVKAPAVPSEWMAPATIAVPLGQGHTAYGRNAEGRGVNVLPFVAFLDHQAADNIALKRTDACETIVTTDGGTRQYGREIIRTVPLSRLGHEPPDKIRYPLPEGYNLAYDLYPAHQHKNHRWGMVVDLNRCTGCSACVTACYAENNLPIAGKEQVFKGREMSWMRIERYYVPGSSVTPAMFIPMLCQQCDEAPCESVCPVFAAHHTEEGLNAQIYNRCVGTRYCSNNCPYKARRFNWFDHDWPAPLNWQLNPDVTVRCRGVMEKCTFCIQRILSGEREAKVQGRALREDDIIPACVQTCPADALIFGDLMNIESRVYHLMYEDPRRYQVLGELDTKPAVIYLKKVINDSSAMTGRES
jgi:anaerobic selenocysteine-containing dehydrogenase/Fe-S-cluster-containing dehydrogenase component